MKIILKKLILTFTLVFVFAILFGSMCIYKATDGTLTYPDGDDYYDNLTDGGFEIVGPCEDGHQMGDWYITQPGSCTEQQIKQRDCIKCGYSDTEMTITGIHDISVYVPGSPATCTKSTRRPYWKCSICGRSEDGINGIYGTPAPDDLGHDFSEEIIDEAHLRTPATCVSPATYYYDCARIGVEADDGVECKCIGEEAFFEYGEKLGSHIDTNSDEICEVCGRAFLCGDNLFWWFDDSNGTLTISGEGEMYNFESSTIPWKDFIEDIKAVVIQDEATSIGQNAFLNSINLTAVYIADSVIRLNKCCFEGCIGLETVNMSENIEIIGAYAFYKCRNLKSLELPDGLTTIGFGALQLCEKINYIEIPASVTEIGSSAFARMYELVYFAVAENNEYYSSLDGVLFDKNRTSIIEYPCSGPIENYIIPNSVKTIYGYTFEDAKNLKTVVVGNNVKNIAGIDVFNNIPTLTSVVMLNPDMQIYDSEDTICAGFTIYGHSGSTAEEYAKKYNRDFVALESPKICGSCGISGDNVKWSLLGETLYIYGEGEMSDYKVNKYAPWYPYKDQINFVLVEEGVTSIGDLAFYKCSKIADVQLSDTIERIGKYAFNGCDSLTEVNIPSSVKVIDSQAFHSCNSLAEFVVDMENLYFASLDGVLYNKEITELVKYPLAKEDLEYFIPEMVTSIAPSAFNGCNYLTEITVNIETIKESAFYDCANLETVYLGSLVKTIEPYAFYNCGKLNNLTLANASVTIGDWSFYKCNKLNVVEYAGTEDEWNTYNFGKDNKPLKNADVVYDFANANAEPTGAMMMFAMRRPPVVEQECQHNYESEITYPTCTSKGYTTYTCGECGDTYTSDETELEKHNFIAIETKATCKTEGFTTYTCNVCGYSYVGDEMVIANHIDENVDGKCDGCGYDFTVECSCKCHSTSIFAKIIWKMTNFFNKIFRKNQACACGVYHY